jgi:MFS family permease
VLAFGTAIFKPGVQGTMGRCLSRENSSVGWGAFYMLVNVGGFLGPPLAHYLYGISWAAVFYGCAAIVALNYLMLFTYKEVPSGTTDGGATHVLARTFANLWNCRLLLFIAIMSGFWLMLMQLFDMLPNFIVDWVDSSELVEILTLPDWMLQQNSLRGPQISQEWLINANGGLIVVSMIFVAHLFSRISRVASISLGTLIGSIGLVLAGFFSSGLFCLLGILVFTVGEMLASPKMNEYLAVIAPPGQSGLYQGYSQIPVAIGWGYGSFLGGTQYDQLGDKANLAIGYLKTNFQIEGVARTDAMQKLCEVSGKSYSEVTDILWSTYHPSRVWYLFAAIGVVSSIAMFFYGRWMSKRFASSPISE